MVKRVKLSLSDNGSPRATTKRNYQFRKDKPTKKGASWRCTQDHKGCPVRMWTSHIDPTLIVSTNGKLSTSNYCSYCT